MEEAVNALVSTELAKVQYTVRLLKNFALFTNLANTIKIYVDLPRGRTRAHVRSAGRRK